MKTKRKRIIRKSIDVKIEEIKRQLTALERMQHEVKMLQYQRA